MKVLYTLIQLETNVLVQYDSIVLILLPPPFCLKFSIYFYSFYFLIF